ncbi:phenylalanine--tRNA ligase subunit beta [Ligilactobacillus sp. LYQ135]
MKVSTKWLNEYVKVDDIDPVELGEKIERTAVEVDSVSKREEGQKKIVVGYVLECVPHPNSDHLHICQVDVGDNEPYQIVCGAPNIAAGQKVIVALPNSWIAGHVKIKKSKMRGEISMGMICGLQEIGFEDKVVPEKYKDGIYVLPADAIPGEPVFKYLGMDESIIDLDITPNRGDLLSMRGVAHEIAAIYDRNVNFEHPEVKENSDYKIDDFISLQESDSNLVAPYKLRMIKNVNVQPSPLWLQKRLWNAGIRPVNNVVDATNYILMDYGQPLHAFDFDQFDGGKFAVKLAQNGEKLTTLNGDEQELRNSDIIIANGDKPVAIAGIMGGLDTEVTTESQNIVLEAAVFNGSMIRKTARRLNLHSDASQRFERGINYATVQEALDNAAALIAKLGDGDIVSGTLEINPYSKKNTEITITSAYINKVLGTSLTDEDVTSIFERLGFEVDKDSTGTLIISVPPRRWDIEIQADLIEEIARIYGYDNIPTTLPTMPLTEGHYTKAQSMIRTARQLLEGAGLSQAISYGLTTETKATRFMLNEAETTALDFPMSSDHTTLRMNLISGLLDDIAYNQARKVNDVALYEQGRVFLRQKDQERPDDVEHIAGALTGLFHQSSWHNEKQPVDFYLTKGIVEYLLHSLGIKDGINYVATAEYEELHPGRTAKIYVNDTLIGLIGQVHPNLAKELKIKPTYVFELDMQQIIALPKATKVYTPVSKYPEINRDIALLVPNEITNAQIVDSIKRNGGHFLVDVKLFDLYQGKNIATGFKSLAYTLVYRNNEGTLNDDEINLAFEKVVNKLQEELEVNVR